MSAETILLLTIFFPLLGTAVIALLGENNQQLSKPVALISSLIPFALSLWFYALYAAKAGAGMIDENGFVFYFSHPWYVTESINVNFTLGVDGISIYLILLNTLLFPLSILFSFASVKTNIRGYYALLLLLEVGVTGFFVALDMSVFYVFFEMVLIPMYFLIGIWGSKDRVYASLKFFLYTLFGSLLMLVALIYLGLQTEGYTFSTDYLQMRAADLTLQQETWLFIAFALAFGIKVPLFPVHTWLPDAHTQAPTAGSVILAGVLLKMGSFGLIRFGLELFPQASFEYANIMAILAVIGIIYGGMAAMVQTDIKRLVAYSSVSHMGFIVLGTFAFTEEAMSGAVIQMINHGISTGALFFLVGMVYDRTHTREIKDYQGIAKVMPRFALVFVFSALASVGLPGLNGFVGEFLVLVGSFKSPAFSWVYTVLATTGVIIAAVYLLWMIRRVFFGSLKEENAKLKDLNSTEMWVMAPLLVLMLVLGLYPFPFLKTINTGTDRVVQNVLKANSITVEAPAQDNDENLEVYREVPGEDEVINSPEATEE